jgi:SprT protein
MKQRLHGVDGEVKFLAHRNVYVGYMNGRIVVTKNTAKAVEDFLLNKYSAKAVSVPAKPATDSTRAAIYAKVHEVIAHANKIYPNLNMAVPTVAFFSRGRVAGRAYWVRHHLEFNEVLARENPESFHETVIHEIAHLVTHKVFADAKQAHGPEFKYVDQSLGGRGTRCHSYDVSSVATKKRKVRYEVKCSCQTHWVTKSVVSNINNPYRKISCKTCKSGVMATGNTKVFM